MQMERQHIKGEYCFNINIYTMFNTFTLRLKEHNLITKNGISFFLNKTIGLGDDTGVIGYVGVGTNPEEPKIEDTSLTNEIVFKDTEAKVENNQIILTLTTIGENIDGTTEIGVYTTNNILISRDVHSEYVVPSTASVKLEYKFTLNQEDKAQEEEEEDD